MRSLWLSVLLFVAGCAPTWVPASIPSNDAPTKVFVCLDLPAERRPAARAAVEAWDQALHAWKHLVAIDGRDEPCSVWVHEVTEVNPDDEHALAWTSTIGGHEVSMRKGWYEQDVTGILLHELGHAFGAQHVPGTLMNANWQPHAYLCPDATTVAQVAAWNRVNLAMLSWCSR